MAKIELPRYFRAKRLGDGTAAYYWGRPSWAKPPAERHGRQCPVDSEALGTDLAAAIAKADRINAIFDEWRHGVEARPIVGTVKWLFAWYRGLDRYKSKAFLTRRDYRRYMDRLEGMVLKSGRKLGERKASEIEARHADAIHTRIEKDSGSRAARYAVQVCRRVWNEAVRDRKRTGVDHNPFVRMGLQSKAKVGNRPTSRDEYDAFRGKARELGHQSMATAAAIMFELVRRETDVFGFEFGGEEAAGAFYWEDYRPGESFAMRQGKTGDAQLIPLRGEPDPDSDDPDVREKGPLLYPALEEELARTRRGQPDRDIDGRPVTTIIIYEASNKRYSYGQARHLFCKIRDKAGLPKTMTLTGFRHGGATELGDAGVEDIRSVSGHRTLQQTATYNKATERKARRAGQMRRAHIAKRANREEGK